MAPEDLPPPCISSEISDAEKQRHLDELEVQYQFNDTIKRYAMESSSSENKEVPVDLNEEKKVDPDDGSASVSSGGTHPSDTGILMCISSVDLVNTQ